MKVPWSLVYTGTMETNTEAQTVVATFSYGGWGSASVRIGDHNVDLDELGNLVLRDDDPDYNDEDDVCTDDYNHFFIRVCQEVLRQTKVTHVIDPEEERQGPIPVGDYVLSDEDLSVTIEPFASRLGSIAGVVAEYLKSH